MFILCIHSTFHRFQQFSLPLYLLSYGIIHQVHPPPFLYLLKALTMLAMPSLLWVNVTAYWLASLPPSSLAAQVLGFTSTVALVTLQELHTHSNANPGFGGGFTALPHLAPPNPSFLLLSPTITQPPPSILAFL